MSDFAYGTLFGLCLSLVMYGGFALGYLGGERARKTK